MSGDSKIGLPAVGSIVRAAAPRRISGDASTPAPASVPARAAADAVPVARLIGLAQDLADQGPPVDVSRVAELRTAIAGGRYVIDSQAIANAMLTFHKGEAA